LVSDHSLCSCSDAAQAPEAVTVLASAEVRFGTTTTQASIVVTRQASALAVPPDGDCTWPQTDHRHPVRHRQWVTIAGLASGEKILVGYQGRRISPRNAHANGVYRVAFRVWKRGTKTVRARGQLPGTHRSQDLPGHPPLTRPVLSALVALTCLGQVE